MSKEILTPEDRLSYSGKKILVTGGGGFIGLHLCKRLSQESNFVVSLDNYFTGTKNNHINGVKYIEGSTKNIFELIDFSPDYIFHLGEYSRVEQSLIDDFNLIFELNKIGTAKVLEFALKNKSKLIYAGSSTKFGDNGLSKDSSPYAWTKASNTELVKNFGDWYGLNYAITYFYNVYGEGERSGKYGTLIAIYKEKYKKGEKLGVVLPGTQKRNFTHISDIVDGLYIVGLRGIGDGFGIGNKNSYSVIEIAKVFGVSIEYLPERKGNRMNSLIDTAQTEALGWSAKTDIITHIRDFLENINNS